ncbi:arylamine N-acetyltransferase family protein [Streptomyces sp. URMC 123]|uniref:arylamine N-acetyltransferase family protein n=1 Tax=Streptomyces sp. URMC 123 TaxID=3423403 RepID=UPI003F1D4E4E
MLDQATVDQYLKRIGAQRPERADIDALRHLHERHVLSVPFENLAYHMDEPVQLNEKVVQKIAYQNRGGGCYELNPAFGYLIASLGFEYEILPGRTYNRTTLGPPLCHMALRVRIGDELWLADVGFGKTSRWPLSFDTEDVQQDPHGEYRLVKADEGGTDVIFNGRPQYRIDDRPLTLADFLPTLWWYRTAPDSTFLQYVFCAMTTENGRITIKDNQLTRAEGGQRVTEDLATDQAVIDAYRTWFGIELDRAPKCVDRYIGQNVDMYLD